MASAVSILIGARAATSAAFAQARADVARLSSSVAAATRGLGIHRRAVSSVAGAYRDADGLWRQADGRLLTQRHTIRQVTTSLGILTDTMHALTDTAIRQGPVLGMLGAKFGGILVAVLPLVGAIGNLIPLLMMVAPAAATGGLAMLTLKLGMNGIMEALEAGLSGKTEDFEKALKKLAPSAASSVRTLVQLRDAWKPLQQSVQQRIFEGFSGELKGLDKYIRPVAERMLPRLAISIGAIRNQLANGLANYAADGRLEKVWGNLNIALSKLMVTAVPLARAFGDFLEVASEPFARVAGYIQKAAEAFGDWVREAKESGKLAEWLEKAMTTFGKLKDIAVNVGMILKGIFTASSNEGDDMLDQIKDATASIAEWVNGDGQGVISFFAGVFKILGQVAPLFEVWSRYFAGISVAAKAAWDFITEIFRTAVGMWLGYLNVLVQGAAKAFGWIPGIGPKLKSAAAEFEAFKNQVNNSLDNIEDEVVNITYRSRMIGDVRVSGSQLSGTYSSGIGGRPSGGPGGSPKQVNEWGHEFVDFTKGMVYNSNETKRMKQAMASGGGGSASVVVEFGKPDPGAHLANATLSEIRAGRLPLFVTVDGRRHQVKPA